jgi:hypothetical protein
MHNKIFILPWTYCLGRITILIYLQGHEAFFHKSKLMGL